mgnify:CR=1 FL=1
MRLEAYAERHNAVIEDFSQDWDAAAASRGWRCLAVFTQEDDCEPDMLLVQSPRWPNFQVRNIASGLSSGTMLTEREVKQWIKGRAGAGGETCAQ